MDITASITGTIPITITVAAIMAEPIIITVGTDIPTADTIAATSALTAA